jgi:hypothetical protein
MTRNFLVHTCILMLLCTTGTRSQSNISRGPIVSNVTQTSITISWWTKDKSSSSIEYGTTPHYRNIIQDSLQTKEHSLSLSGLQPSTQYHYRVIAEGTTPDYYFSTSVRPHEPFVFAAYGDTRTNHDIHTAVLNLIQRHHPLFAINTGDLVSSSTEANWNMYFTILCNNTTIGQTLPIYSSIGNHENNSPAYFQYLHLPHNNSENSQSYYSFEYGSAHFIALNSTINYEPGTPQYNWFVKDLESAATAKFRFVFLHHPVYSSYPHGSTEKVQEYLLPLFEQYNVQMVFSGHDHAYERTKPMNGVTYVVTGGGGAPLYDSQSDNNWTAYKEKAYHYLLIVLNVSFI